MIASKKKNPDRLLPVRVSACQKSLAEFAAKAANKV